ncbi:MAG: GNAT family N-acetyltransferase [Acidimicrobiales bacterium]
MQARAREAAYRSCWPEARSHVVEVGGEAAGRLLVDEGDDSHRVVDIALLAPFRGRGVGSRVLAGVVERADAAGVPVRLSVARSSPAVALYRRMGFEVVADEGLDLAMERLPSATGTTPGGALAVLDWRRQVAALYREVRRCADPAAGHALWRAGRDRLLATHPASPVPTARRAAFAGASVAPYDPGLRFVAQVETAVAPVRLEVPTGTDGVVPFDRVGVVHLPGLGVLDVWWLASYGGGIFVPLRDASAGLESYGGGRYLLDTAKGADLGGDGGRLVVDLNFAYNPSCAYDPAWACPLAPPGNALGVAVRAGELSPQP